MRKLEERLNILEQKEAEEAALRKWKKEGERKRKQKRMEKMGFLSQPMDHRLLFLMNLARLIDRNLSSYLMMRLLMIKNGCGLKREATNQTYTPGKRPNGK